MKNLLIDDSKQNQKIVLNIEERIIQLPGKLFGFDTMEDKYYLLFEDSFLCVDRLAGQDFSFLLHITNFD